MTKNQIFPLHSKQSCRRASWDHR